MYTWFTNEDCYTIFQLKSFRYPASACICTVSILLQSLILHSPSDPSRSSSPPLPSPPSWALILVPPESVPGSACLGVSHVRPRVAHISVPGIGFIISPLRLAPLRATLEEDDKGGKEQNDDGGQGQPDSGGERGVGGGVVVDLSLDDAEDDKVEDHGDESDEEGEEGDEGGADETDSVGAEGDDGCQSGQTCEKGQL